MRPHENVKTNNINKTDFTGKSGPLIRLPIKKTYCPKCQRLTRGQPQGSKSTLQIICPRCSQPLWYWKSTAWRSAGVEVISP